MLVIGARRIRSDATEETARQSNKLKRARGRTQRAGRRSKRHPILTEEEFCRLAGVPTPEALKRQYHALRDLLARYGRCARITCATW